MKVTIELNAYQIPVLARLHLLGDTIEERVKHIVVDGIRHYDREQREEAQGGFLRREAIHGKEINKGDGGSAGAPDTQNVQVFC